MQDLQDVGGEITGNKHIHYGFQEFEIISRCWTHMKQTYLLSFDANVSSFSLAKSPPRDLQITVYKWWRAHTQCCLTVLGCKYYSAHA